MLLVASFELGGEDDPWWSALGGFVAVAESVPVAESEAVDCVVLTSVPPVAVAVSATEVARVEGVDNVDGGPVLAGLLSALSMSSRSFLIFALITSISCPNFVTSASVKGFVGFPSLSRYDFFFNISSARFKLSKTVDIITFLSSIPTTDPSNDLVASVSRPDRRLTSGSSAPAVFESLPLPVDVC